MLGRGAAHYTAARHKQKAPQKSASVACMHVLPALLAGTGAFEIGS